jgi:predicted TIM-barrel fold metal-dependent hydrolase
VFTRREAFLALLAKAFEMPAHACDCHTHIFPDPAKFPMIAERTYTPEIATPEQMDALHRTLGIERVVIVTPSVYGTDNSATLYGLKARGNTARGVAVIGERTTDAELDAMGKGGIRGIRLNLATAGPTDPAVARRRFDAAVRRLRGRGWHIQIYARPEVVARIRDLVLDAPMPVVFDHFGGAQAALGVGQPGFGDLVELVRSGKAYVKISGAYRASTRGPDYADVTPFAKSLIAANPDRILWGTDWPHPDTAPGRSATEVRGPLPIDDARLLDQLAVWAPDAATRRKILADNPARLYEFP